jgi:hypothetical protein
MNYTWVAGIEVLTAVPVKSIVLWIVTCVVRQKLTDISEEHTSTELRDVAARKTVPSLSKLLSNLVIYLNVYNFQ